MIKHWSLSGFSSASPAWQGSYRLIGPQLPNSQHFIHAKRLCGMQKDATYMDLMINIREIEKTEISHLDNFLYEAIFIPEEQEKPNKEIIKIQELSCYIKGFEKDSDIP